MQWWRNHLGPLPDIIWQFLIFFLLCFKGLFLIKIATRDNFYINIMSQPNFQKLPPPLGKLNSRQGRRGDPVWNASEHIRIWVLTIFWPISRPYSKSGQSMARHNLKKSKYFSTSTKYHSIKVHTQEAQNLHQLKPPFQTSLHKRAIFQMFW